MGQLPRAPQKKRKRKKNDMQVAGGIKMTKFHDDFFEGWCNFHFNYLKLKISLLQHEIMSATSVMIQAQMTFKIPAAFSPLQGTDSISLLNILVPWLP